MPEIDINAQKLYYETNGLGSPCLVFIHGATCDLSNWQTQMNYFSKTHTVICLDLNGHGKSERNLDRLNINYFADDVVELIENLELNNVILIGHSMGCRVAVQAATLSDKIKALVLIDGAYLVKDRPPKDDTQRKVVAEKVYQRVRSVFESNGVRVQQRKGLSAMFFDEAFAPLRDTIIEKATSLPEEQILTLMPNFASWDNLYFDKAVEAVDLPMLVFQSTYMNEHHERQQFTQGATTPWLELIKELQPNAIIKEVYDAGHFLMMEQSDMINTEIKKFMTLI